MIPVMRALETVSGLEGFERRTAGTDGERRGARWLADQLTAGGREVVIEPFWCRPQWALAHAWHVALALGGSLVTVASAHAGAVMLLAALVCIAADALTGVSPGRRLTPERASQNVVAVRRAAADDAKPVRLIVTANYDAGRTGVVYRERFRRITTALRRATGGLSPGWLAWLSIVILSLLGLAIVRIEGHHSASVGAIQLVPTIVLVLAFAALLELATSDPGPAAGDNATGVAVAVELARALDAAPAGHLEVELVLAGAGDGTGIGMRRYLRARRSELKASNTVVLGVAACSQGTPRWWTSDGTLLTLRYARELRALCARIAQREPGIGAAATAGRDTSPGLPARMARLPAITIGCLDEHGLVPRSHQRDDTAEAIDSAAIDAAVQFALMLVDEIDATVAGSRPPRAATPA